VSAAGPVLLACDAGGLGGAEILAASLAAALIRRGHDLRFVVAPERGSEAWVTARLPAHAIAAAPLRNKAAYRLRALGAALDLRRIREVARTLSALGPRRVIVNQADPEDGVVVAHAAHALGLPLASLLHVTGDPGANGARRLLGPRRRLARHAFARWYGDVITVSEASAREARALWTPRVTAVANGIELPAPEAPGERERARAALGVPAGARVIAALGRLSPEKGLEDLLELLPRVRAGAPDATLVIAGEGELRQELEGGVRAAGLERSVRLVGHRPAREVLLAADVLAMPSRFEGMLVAYAVGGIPEVLEASAMVAPGDRAALAAALVATLTGRELREERAARLQARVRAEHGIDRMAERFEAALRL
jgi:glycosyltransferase involved in cell wall biosynthesis